MLNSYDKMPSARLYCNTMI